MCANKWRQLVNATEVTAGLTESNIAAYRQVNGLLTCWLTACTPNQLRAQRSITSMGEVYLFGPIPWGYSGPLCHALSLLLLLLLLSWTSHAACAIAIAGVRLATPGDWQCNGGSQ